MKRNDGWLNDGWLHKQLTTNKTRLVIVVVHSTSCCVTLIHTHSNCASKLSIILWHTHSKLCIKLSIILWLVMLWLYLVENIMKHYPFQPPSPPPPPTKKKGGKKFLLMSWMTSKPIWKIANINYEHISRLLKFEWMLWHISQHGICTKCAKLSIGWTY